MYTRAQPDDRRQRRCAGRTDSRSPDSAARRCPPGRRRRRVKVDASAPSGIDVEILEKDTRATAISFGFPDRRDPRASRFRRAVGRARLARRAPAVVGTALPADSRGARHQLRRLRLHRSVSARDVPVLSRSQHRAQRQIFEIWIRPVVPANAHMSLRIAIHELDALIRNGLTTAASSRTTRDYLMKNVYVMTARQDQQLGYALDSRWYGIGEFTDYMREAAAEADRRAGERRDQAPSHRPRSVDRHRHQGCRRR